MNSIVYSSKWVVTLAILYNKDALDCYDGWPNPVVIMSDGPYGIIESRGGYHGDGNRITDLNDFYEPHIKAWSEHSTSMTTLWLWCSELGWANIHTMLNDYGWEYRSSNVWDKGISHVAGNCNTNTLRMFPVVTEICVHYIKRLVFGQDNMSAQDWLISEWSRSGLPFCLANEVCGVKNAASRKWLTKDHLWYLPPTNAFNDLADYANKHGNPHGAPYFSLKNAIGLVDYSWDKIKAKFKLPVGITNVWRDKKPSGKGRFHPNQKPDGIIDMIIQASSDPGDVIWEPFGGSCPVARLCDNRDVYSAEIDNKYYDLANQLVRM